MPNQTPEQRETVAQLEMGRTERIESVLSHWIGSGYPVEQFFSEHDSNAFIKRGYSVLAFQPCKFVSGCAGHVGLGDSRREADAQLAQKLVFSRL